MSTTQLIVTGRELAEQLIDRNLARTPVLAIPSRGALVGHQCALRMKSPMDLVLARKLVVANDSGGIVVGAVALPDVRMFSPGAGEAAGAATLRALADTALHALHARLPALRGDAPLPDLAGRTVLVVDDVAITGLTMAAALVAIRGYYRPSRILAALGACTAAAHARLLDLADELVVLDSRPVTLDGDQHARSALRPPLRDEDLHDLARQTRILAGTDLYGGLEVDGLAATETDAR